MFAKSILLKNKTERKKGRKVCSVTIGPACGGIMTLSSYNSFNRNCHRDAIIIALANAMTSVFCGAVVFAGIGYAAHISGKNIEEVSHDFISS